MNFGIIGFGNISRKFVNSIKATDTGKIYAIGSASLSKEDTYLLENPEVIVYRDYEEVLQDENVDAVYIALPHNLHYEWIIKALERNIPVLCEKPAVLHVTEVDSIQKAVKTYHTYFLEALKTKFNRGLEQLKIDLALIGNIQEVEANFCFDATPTKNTSSYLFDPKQGGALHDIGSYVIGFALTILPEEILEVEGTIAMVEGIESNFQTTLTFESGAKAYLEGAIDTYKDRYARITGTKGSIDIPMFNRIQKYTITLQNGEQIERDIPIVGDDMTLEIQCFIDDVGAGEIESKVHSITDTRKILEVSEAIRKVANVKNASQVVGE